MDGETVVALCSAIGGLVLTVCTPLLALRQQRTPTILARREELRIAQSGWVWAVGQLQTMRSFIAKHQLTEPDHWQIDDHIDEFERRMMKAGRRDEDRDGDRI